MADTVCRQEFLASLHLQRLNLKFRVDMTPEERRWANGLRPATRTSSVPVLVEPSTMRRNTAMKRPSTEVTRRSENGFAPASLAATVALKAYLSTDTDAQSRIPHPRPVKAPTRKEEVKFTEGRRLTNDFQQPEIKLEENAKPSLFQTPVDTVVETIPTSRRDVATRAESPLSRFQKHVKQTQSTLFESAFRYTSTNILHKMYSPHHSSRERDIPKAKTPLGGPSQTLTRSLMDKIQEARRLRQTEAPNEHRSKSRYQDRACKRSSNCNFLEIDEANIPTNTPPPVLVSLPKRSPAPPIPHAKPVMPAIPRLPSPLSTDKFTKHGQAEEVLKELAKELVVKAIPSCDDIITATKAVQTIQRIWRQKRPRICRHRRNDGAPEQNQVTLVVDRDSGNECVIPLFSTTRMKCQELIEQQPVSDLSRSAAECEVDSSTISDDEAHGVGLQCPGDMAACWPSYNPWTDHELVFLEEGRCVGELQESVRKGVLMDQEELVWKRPQHVIQQLEAQRIAMIMKSRRRRAPCQQAEYDSTPVARVGTLEHVTSSAGDTSSPVQMSSPENFEQKMIIASKRKFLRISFKHKNASRKVVACVARRSSRSKTRRLSVRVQRNRDSRRDNVTGHTKGEERTRPEVLQVDLGVDHTGAPLDGSESNSQRASYTINSIDEIDEERLLQNDPTATEANIDILDRFVLFSDSGKSSTEGDAIPILPRNDLISDMSLLYEEHLSRAKDELTEKPKGFIPLTALPPLTREIDMPLYETVSPKVETLMVTCCGDRGDDDDDGCDEQEGDNRNTGNRALESFVQPIGSVSENLKALKYDVLPMVQEQQVDNQCAYSSNTSTSSSSPSRKKYPGDMPRQRNMADDNPLRALKVMKSAVTDTMARIHTEYRHELALDDCDATCSQQFEPLPSVRIVTTAHPQLIDDKRKEFLRVLGDFKRCVRQSCLSNQMDNC